MQNNHERGYNLIKLVRLKVNLKIINFETNSILPPTRDIQFEVEYMSLFCKLIPKSIQ